MIARKTAADEFAAHLSNIGIDVKPRQNSKTRISTYLLENEAYKALNERCTRYGEDLKNMLALFFYLCVNLLPALLLIMAAFTLKVIINYFLP